MVKIFSQQFPDEMAAAQVVRLARLKRFDPTTFARVSATNRENVVAVQPLHNLERADMSPRDGQTSVKEDHGMAGTIRESGEDKAKLEVTVIPKTDDAFPATEDSVTCDVVAPGMGFYVTCNKKRHCYSVDTLKRHIFATVLKCPDFTDFVKSVESRTPIVWPKQLVVLDPMTSVAFSTAQIAQIWAHPEPLSRDCWDRFIGETHKKRKQVEAEDQSLAKAQQTNEDCKLAKRLAHGDLDDQLPHHPFQRRFNNRLPVLRGDFDISSSQFDLAEVISASLAASKSEEDACLAIALSRSMYAFGARKIGGGGGGGATEKDEMRWTNSLDWSTQLNGAIQRWTIAWRAVKDNALAVCKNSHNSDPDLLQYYRTELEKNSAVFREASKLVEAAFEVATHFNSHVSPETREMEKEKEQDSKVELGAAFFEALRSEETPLKTRRTMFQTAVRLFSVMYTQAMTTSR